MSDPVYPPQWREWKVGLCHDWLTGMRGGERVLELLGDGFPQAEIHTLVHNRAAISERINRHPVRTSPLQKLPGIFEHYRSFLPVMPLMARAWKPAPDLDLLVSTSHCVAKGIRTSRRTRHLCYCFTPMRYAWLFQEEYFPSAAKRALLRPLLAALRVWDRRSAVRVDRFVAISEHVRERIQRFYGREADVVYPPADTDYFCPAPVPREDFDFIISALVPYKKVDLAVRAYTRSGYPLKVMGSGSGLEALKSLAGPNVEFLGRQPDEVLRDHYRRCRFLLFPGEEDYGIVPVEAMACGTPVIAYARGGATETVLDGVSGVYFHEQSEESLLAAVETASAKTWDRDAIRVRAEQFGVQAFLDGMDRCMRACLA
jgi:glycosyltransferase involved in cell wall biosynthesis